MGVLAQPAVAFPQQQQQQQPKKPSGTNTLQQRPEVPAAGFGTVPVAAPVAVAVPASSAVFNHTKQQPEAPAGYGNQGWVFGGVRQGAGALPPYLPAGFAAASGYAPHEARTYPKYEASAVPTMAAGHSAPGLQTVMTTTAA
jgi:hypothetical protein